MSDNPRPPLKVVLYCYGKTKARGDPHWSLPTFDPHSLAAMTYMQFAGVPYEKNECNDPTMSPSRSLPFLIINGINPITGHDNIIDRLENEVGYKIDSHMTEEQRADGVAYKSLVEDRLYLSQLYNWWIEPKNGEFTSIVYATALPFPASWVVPRQYKNNMQFLLRVKGLIEEEKAYSSADGCYKSLSSKLADKKYLFGNRPSTLDAIVFAYLATQYSPPYPAPKLRALIDKYQNLVNYCNNILHEFFGIEPPPLSPNQIKEHAKKEDAKFAKKNFNPRRNRAKRMGKLVNTVGIGSSSGIFIYYEYPSSELFLST